MKPLTFDGLAAHRAAFVVARLGLVGWIGIGALLLAAFVGLFVVPGIEHANVEQAREIATLQRQWEQLQDPKNARALRDPLAALIASLPPATEVPGILTAIERRADLEAVGIDRTEYRIQPVFGHAALRYRLSFPAHVDYPHLRAWLEALLHDYPSLALDELTLRREVDGGEELEAHVGLSFLAREGQ